MLLEKYETPSKTQVTKVRLAWEPNNRDSDVAWNEICAWTMEQFGLPGTRFNWHPTEDFMDFYFHHEEDAIHFMLRWS